MTTTDRFKMQPSALTVASPLNSLAVYSTTFRDVADLGFLEGEGDGSHAESADVFTASKVSNHHKLKTIVARDGFQS